MASAATHSAKSVVVDANVLIAIYAREADKFTQAEAALGAYAASGSLFYAPGLMVGEVLYVLCRKLQDGLLSQSEHETAVRSFLAEMYAVLPPPGGDAALITRANEIRSNYGCSRSADSVYLALAQALAAQGTVELPTFDEDLKKQASKETPSISVNLLPC